jgi:GH15 family glucan-1,4-alpha-glucosidase
VERLETLDGLLFRNEDDILEGEGAFGICGFWRVGLLAQGAGSSMEAEEAFRKQLAFANDVGLYAEEIAPDTGEARGNFPQAFTHVGLISAALELEAARPWREPVRGASGDEAANAGASGAGASGGEAWT